MIAEPAIAPSFVFLRADAGDAVRGRALSSLRPQVRSVRTAGRRAKRRDILTDARPRPSDCPSVRMKLNSSRRPTVTSTPCVEDGDRDHG